MEFVNLQSVVINLETYHWFYRFKTIATLQNVSVQIFVFVSKQLFRDTLSWDESTVVDHWFGGWFNRCKQNDRSFSWLVTSPILPLWCFAHFESTECIKLLFFVVVFKKSLLRKHSAVCFYALVTQMGSYTCYEILFSYCWLNCLKFTFLNKITEFVWALEF